MEIAEINIKSIQLNIKEVTEREAETTKTLMKEKAKLVKMQLEMENLEQSCNKHQYLADHTDRQLADVCDLIPQKEATIKKMLQEISDLHVSIDHISDQRFKANMVLSTENSQRRLSTSVMQKHLDKEQKLKDKRVEKAAMKLMKKSEDAIKMKKLELTNAKEELERKIQAAKEVKEEKENAYLELTSGMLPLRNRNRALMLRLRNQLKRTQELKLDVSKRLDSLEQKFNEVQSNIAAIKNNNLSSSNEDQFLARSSYHTAGK